MLTPYQFASNRPIDGVDLEGLEYLSVNHPAFANKTRPSSGFFDFLSGCNKKPTAGEVMRKTYEIAYSKVTIAGQQYYDIGRHLYYDGVNLNNSGTRKQQATEATQVGITLISQFSQLSDQPLSNIERSYHDDSKQSIERTRKEALEFKNCLGVCWAVTQSRVDNAYGGIFDFKISKKNLDHALSSISGDKNNPYYGMGVGGALLNLGLGTLVEDIWAGGLQTGAVLQIFRQNGTGHSQIFRRYLYDEGGNIIGIDAIDNNNQARYSDGATGNFIEKSTKDKIIGVNLIDNK